MTQKKIDVSYAEKYLDEQALPLTNYHLYKVLDESIPREILEFLEKKFEHTVSTTFPNAWFNNDPTVISNNNEIKESYKQWYLKKEPNFTEWVNDDYKLLDEYFMQWVNDIYHFKFSLTSAETDISWHVLHRLPRIHIPLSDNSCFFDIVDTDQKIHEVELIKGKVYLLNVCYPHRAKNPNNTPRKQAFFEFNSIKSTV